MHSVPTRIPLESYHQSCVSASECEFNYTLMNYGYFLKAVAECSNSVDTDLNLEQLLLKEAMNDRQNEWGQRAA